VLPTASQDRSFIHKLNNKFKHSGGLKEALYGGYGSKPTHGINPISTSTKIVSVGPWGPTKIFLSSKMMNFQFQHIQKREIVDFEIIKYKYKSKKNTLSHSPQQKDGRYS